MRSALIQQTVDFICTQGPLNAMGCGVERGQGFQRIGGQVSELDAPIAKGSQRLSVIRKGFARPAELLETP